MSTLIDNFLSILYSSYNIVAQANQLLALYTTCYSWD